MARGVPARKECSEAELRFCSVYIQNADTKAAVLAGWPDHKWPTKYGPKVLARPHVIKHLAAMREKIAAKYDISAERVLNEIAEIAFNKLGKFIRVNNEGEPSWDFTGATPEELAAIGELTVDVYQDGRGPSAQTVKKFKISERDRLAALTLLGKSMGLFAENVNVRHRHELTIVERLNRGRDRLRQIDKQGAIDVQAS